jgi:hypothetical protein
VLRDALPEAFKLSRNFLASKALKEFGCPCSDRHSRHSCLFDLPGLLLSNLGEQLALPDGFELCVAHCLPETLNQNAPFRYIDRVLELLELVTEGLRASPNFVDGDKDLVLKRVHVFRPLLL